jgi:hypothetical protein
VYSSLAIVSSIITLGKPFSGLKTTNGYLYIVYKDGKDIRYISIIVDNSTCERINGLEYVTLMVDTNYNYDITHLYGNGIVGVLFLPKLSNNGYYLIDEQPNISYCLISSNWQTEKEVKDFHVTENNISYNDRIQSVHDDVLNTILVEGDKCDIGVNIQECTRVLGHKYTKDTVIETIRDLEMEGKIYSTVSADVYKFAM